MAFDRAICSVSMDTEANKQVYSLLNGETKLKGLRLTYAHHAPKAWESLRRIIHNALVLTKIYKYDTRIVYRAATNLVNDWLKYNAYESLSRGLREVVKECSHDWDTMVKHFKLTMENFVKPNVNSKFLKDIVAGRDNGHAIGEIHDLVTLKYALKLPFHGQVFFDQRTSKNDSIRAKRKAAGAKGGKVGGKASKSSRYVKYSLLRAVNLESGESVVVVIGDITNPSTRDRIKSEFAGECDAVKFTNLSREEWLNEHTSYAEDVDADERAFIPCSTEPESGERWECFKTWEGSVKEYEQEAPDDGELAARCLLFKELSESEHRKSLFKHSSESVSDVLWASPCK